MTSQNPLQRYFRQPKLFVSLPSKGMYYNETSLQGDHANVPIFAMTGMDEIIMKTPDALFSGEATIKLIESCCPYIKNAKDIPSLDVDVLLIAIRTATFGEKMAVTHTCPNCGSENPYDVDLPGIIDQYQTKTFDNQVQIDDIVVNLKPLSYNDMTKFNIENFKLQKTLSHLHEVEDEVEKQKHFDSIYQQLGTIQASVLLDSIESVRTPTDTVTDRAFIGEWLANTVASTYQVIKTKLEDNKKAWAIPKFKVVCDECQHHSEFEVVMDQSSFFA